MLMMSETAIWTSTLKKFYQGQCHKLSFKTKTREPLVLLLSDRI